MSAPLRLGVLGAARITPWAVVAPARKMADDVVVSAVAARDGMRAQRFADKHRIARVLDSYEALINDDAIDAVYVPLPNSLHHEWTIKALAVGKHVLCEKPLSANSDEAKAMRDAATAHGRVLMEAFHWRYHPLARTAVDAARELGALTHVRAVFIIPFFVPGDIRYRADLAGGALSDTGSYSVSIARALAGLEGRDVDIVIDDVRAKWTKGGVDRWIWARVHDADNPSCSIEVEAGLASAKILAARAVARSANGVVDIWNPVAPQFGHLLRTRTPKRRTLGMVGSGTTYAHQLREFVAACRGESATITDGAEGVRTMAFIDAVRAAAKQS